MAYTPGEFEYGLKAYDALDLSVETADILASRDVGLENFLRDQTTAIKTETDSLQTQISSIASAPTGWGSYSATLRRGTTIVGTDTFQGAYAFNENLCFVNLQLEVTSTGSFPGNQVISISLPVSADSTTRVLGTAMYQGGGVFYQCVAFIESNTVDGSTFVMLPDRGGPWLGQLSGGVNTDTVTPNGIEGVRTGDYYYANLVYRVAV